LNSRHLLEDFVARWREVGFRVRRWLARQLVERNRRPTRRVRAGTYGDKK
jgi:hypothetical protein